MKWIHATWELVKSAPWTFGVGVVVFVGAVIGVIYGVRRHYDRGFLKIDGKTIRWPEKNIPLVFAHTSEVGALQLAILQRVVNEINRSCDRDIIHKKIRRWYDTNVTDATIGELLKCIGDETTLINVLVDIDYSLPTNVGGSTRLNWDSKTGELKAAYINLPPENRGDTTWVIIAHEVGHALGLDHDDKRESIMHERVSRRQQYFTTQDKNRLRKRYN